MKRIAFAIAAVFMPLSAHAATPLDELIRPKEGEEACFIRVYKADHLKAHPQQKTTTINLWMKYKPIPGVMSGYALYIALGITQRGDQATLFSQGSCEWMPTANRDTSNNRLIKAYPKDAGAVCMQSAQPDVFESVSAQEGGHLILDRGKDRNTLMVYLDDSLTMVKRANRGKHLNIRFGPEDRVFMLQRVEPESCTAVEDAVMTPEPGVKRR